MKRIFLLPLLAGLLGSGTATAQDIIYLADGSQLTCNITGLTSKQVAYQESGTTTEKRLEAAQVHLIFSQEGKLALFDPADPRGYRSYNLQDQLHDRMLLINGEVLLGGIISEDIDNIRYYPAGMASASPQIQPVSGVLLVLYRDGKHILYGETGQCADYIRRNGLDGPGMAATPDEPPTPGSSTPAPAQEIELNLEEFNDKALDKTKTLSQYISIIADRGTPFQEANDAIELSVALFISEEAQVEVSSSTTPEKKRYPIRRYLDRLKLLKYDQVEITWSDITYVSKLQKGVDGNYYGVITFMQRFTGYKEGKPVYSDVTRKNIEVILKGYTKEVGGETRELWDVFLSDIGVVNTSRG
ncbi:MAG: hypothetical protein SF053_20970 [Bacteroidia bacterium]|nr:hypothetical protein [Bacteroidia bacterium]